MNIITAPVRGTFPTIIEVGVVNEFFDVKTHRLSLRFCLRALEILEKVTYPLLDASQLIKYATQTFLLLSKKDTLEDVKKLWIFFELCVLEYLGAKPDIKKISANLSLNQLAGQLEKRIYHVLQ